MKFADTKSGIKQNCYNLSSVCIHECMCMYTCVYTHTHTHRIITALKMKMNVQCNLAFKLI